MHGILEKNPSHIRPGSYPGRPTMGIRLGPKKGPRFHWFNGLVLLGNFTGKPLFIPFFEWENNSGFRLRLDFPNKTNPLNGGIIIPQYDYTISLLIQKKIEVCTS